MSSRAPVRILLIDDHAIVRVGFAMLLAQHDWCAIVAEAGTGELGYQYFREHRPDVVIIDLSLPKMSGITTILRIMALDPGARILVVSMHEETVYVTQAMRAGASGYLTKASAPEELVDAIRAVARGRNFISNALAQQVVMYNLRGQASPFEQLSAREFEIVSLATSGMDARDIGTRLALSHKTVANYLSQVKRKLNVGNHTELMRLAIRHGIVGLERDLGMNEKLDGS